MLLLVAITGCPTPPPQPPQPAAPIDAAPAPAVDAPAAPAPVTDAECTQFVDHALAVGMAQQRATKRDAYVPTDDQVAVIRANLIASRPCVGLSRPQWTCALAATTQDALYACAQ